MIAYPEPDLFVYQAAGHCPHCREPLEAVLYVSVEVVVCTGCLTPLAPGIGCLVLPTPAHRRALVEAGWWPLVRDGIRLALRSKGRFGRLLPG
jgi:hypothetical protein